MDSLDLSNISNYEDYMMTTSDWLSFSLKENYFHLTITIIILLYYSFIIWLSILYIPKRFVEEAYWNIKDCT